nr:hypothetical protein [Myceligenerans salitolerans]
MCFPAMPAYRARLATTRQIVLPSTGWAVTTPPARTGEQPARVGAANLQPQQHGADPTGVRLFAGRHRDDLPLAAGVGLGTPHRHEHAAWLELEVGQGQCGQLRAAQRPGEAEQDHRAITGTERGARVDPGDDRTDVLGQQGPAA